MSEIQEGWIKYHEDENYVFSCLKIFSTKHYLYINITYIYTLYIYTLYIIYIYIFLYIIYIVVLAVYFIQVMRFWTQI